MTYPREFAEGEIPKTGDKVEMTVIADGTVTVGTVFVVHKSTGGLYAATKNGTIIWRNYECHSPVEYRLLYRIPAAPKAGDTVPGSALNELPAGTIFRTRGGLLCVKLAHTNTTFAYRCVTDPHRAWGEMRGTVTILFIPFD